MLCSPKFANALFPRDDYLYIFRAIEDRYITLNMERKYRPPNLKLQEKSQGFDLPPKIMKTGAVFGGHKGKHSKDYKEWKAVSHSVSILFNGR